MKTLTGNTNFPNNCLDQRQCRDAYGCISGQCQACDIQCKTCSGTSTAQCTSCFATSVSYNQLSIPTGPCIMDFVDFSKFTDPIVIQVPPAIHWRVTLDFWTFIHDTAAYGNTAVNLIFTDFLSISITQNSLNNNNVDIYCTPIEYMYPVTGINKRTNLLTQLNTTLQAFYLKDTISNTSSKWFYTRCSFNFHTAQVYLNQTPVTTLPVPQQYQNLSDFPWFQKKFYKLTATTTFRIENSATSPTEIYFRNINVYREFLPQNMDNLKYL